MRPQRIPFLLTFLAGMVATVLVAIFSGSVASVAATRYEDLSLFTNVLNLVRRNYVEPVEDSVLVRGAVRGMLQELDPHSSFLDIDAYKEMQVDTRGEFHGLGIEITKSRDGFIEVVAPIEGTPAAQAGIRARDQIVAICPTEPPEDWTEECRNTKSMTLFEAVKKIWCMSYVDREKRVVKYGKFWPLKFYLGDQEMCCFFAYSRKEDIPLADCRIELVKDGVEAYGSIKENINSYYMPIILELKDVWIDAKRADDIRLIIYH